MTHWPNKRPGVDAGWRVLFALLRRRPRAIRPGVGTEMRTALLAFTLMLAQTALAVGGVATLQELLNDINRSDVVLLDQGYRGEFTKVYDEVPSGERGVAEFTHAWFNQRGVGNRSAATPTIAIGISRKEENGQSVPTFRALAAYKKTIPDFEDLKKMPKIKDFETAFGLFRGIIDHWGSPGEKHSSLGWLAFSLSSGGSIRVVSVSLHTVDKGNGWEIYKRDISEGVFYPTGHPPKMEVETAEPDGAANRSQPVRPEKNQRSPTAGPSR